MTPTTTASYLPSLTMAPALADFWTMDQAARERLLLEGIATAHAYHYERNTAYRSTVAVRGIGLSVRPPELPRLLRTTSRAFTSYVDILGTPFPQGRPVDFVDWLAEQMSVDLEPDPHRFRNAYRSLHGLLKAVERAYDGLGLELLTSDDSSTRVTVVPRDRRSTEVTTESFGLSFERYWGLKPEHTAIFMTPKRTRSALTRGAGYGLRRVGLPPNRVHFTVPLPASPDSVRVRAGRAYRPGLRGSIERHVSHPVMAAVQARLVDAQAVEGAVSQLIEASARNDKVLLLGSPGHLHMIASFLLDSRRTITLAPGSLLATIGSTPQTSAKARADLRDDLGEAFLLTGGGPVPIRDMYGMPEANWAAMQCSAGSYHIPPWVYAVTVDDEERLQKEPRSAGLLAFFDPYGGGDLFPSFFRTADRVTLVRGETCPCGEPGSYLEEGSIQRVDTFGEAGCTGQV
jgi:hypothetical protein